MDLNQLQQQLADLTNSGDPVFAQAANNIQQMVEAADAHAGVVDGFARFGAFDDLGHHLLWIVGREVLAGHNGHRSHGHTLDQAKVSGRVLDGLHRQGGEDQFVGRALEQEVAVSGRIHHFLSRDGPACTAQVFDDDGLLELCGQGHGDFARDDVRQATCWVGHHQAHWLVGKALRL